MDTVGDYIESFHNSVGFIYIILRYGRDKINPSRASLQFPLKETSVPIRGNCSSLHSETCVSYQGIGISVDATESLIKTEVIQYQLDPIYR